MVVSWKDLINSFFDTVQPGGSGVLTLPGISLSY